MVILKERFLRKDPALHFDSLLYQGNKKPVLQVRLFGKNRRRSFFQILKNPKENFNV